MQLGLSRILVHNYLSLSSQGLLEELERSYQKYPHQGNYKYLKYDLKAT
jgi:hypothetical protein